MKRLILLLIITFLFNHCGEPFLQRKDYDNYKIPSDAISHQQATHSIATIQASNVDHNHYETSFALYKDIKQRSKVHSFLRFTPHPFFTSSRSINSLRDYNLPKRKATPPWINSEKPIIFPIGDHHVATNKPLFSPQNPPDFKSVRRQIVDNINHGPNHHQIKLDYVLDAFRGQLSRNPVNLTNGSNETSFHRPSTISKSREKRKTGSPDFILKKKDIFRSKRSLFEGSKPLTVSVISDHPFTIGCYRLPCNLEDPTSVSTLPPKTPSGLTSRPSKTTRYTTARKNTALSSPASSVSSSTTFPDTSSSTWTDTGLTMLSYTPTPTNSGGSSNDSGSSFLPWLILLILVLILLLILLLCLLDRKKNSEENARRASLSSDHGQAKPNSNEGQFADANQRRNSSEGSIAITLVLPGVMGATGPGYIAPGYISPNYMAPAYPAPVYPPPGNTASAPSQQFPPVAPGLEFEPQTTSRAQSKSLPQEECSSGSSSSDDDETTVVKLETVKKDHHHHHPVHEDGTENKSESSSDDEVEETKVQIVQKRSHSLENDDEEPNDDEKNGKKKKKAQRNKKKEPKSGSNGKNGEPETKENSTESKIPSKDSDSDENTVKSYQVSL